MKFFLKKLLLVFYLPKIPVHREKERANFRWKVVEKLMRGRGNFLSIVTAKIIDLERENLFKNGV